MKGYEDMRWALFRIFIKPRKTERRTAKKGNPGQVVIRIPEKVMILTLQGIFKKIPGNLREDSEECSKGFRGMFEKILGNVREYSGKCYQRCGGMFGKILQNVQEDIGERFQFTINHFSKPHFTFVLRFTFTICS